MKQQLINFYLEYWNDFITIDHFAEYHGITYGECVTMLNLGRKYHMQKTDIEQYNLIY